MGGGGKSGAEASGFVCFTDASTKHCATGYVVHACLAGERANVNNIVEFGRHGDARRVPAFGLRPLPLELAGVIGALRAAARVLDIGQDVGKAAASSSSPAGETAGAQQQRVTIFNDNKNVYGHE